MNKKSKIVLIMSSMVIAATIPTVVFLTSCSSVQSQSHTNIQNETQQYANDNSISLGFAFQPNYDYALAEITDFFENDSTLPKEQENAIVWTIIETSKRNANSTNLLFGTSWMIDYKVNTSTNINTYYLATNTHVLDLSYSISASFRINGNPNIYSYEFNFPVNSQSVNFLRLFLSQPQGISDENLEYNASYSDFLTSWYATNIDKNNINNSLLQYANNTNETKFDFTFDYTGFTDTLLIKSDNSTIEMQEQIKQTTSTPSLDSSILKLNINPNNITVPNTNAVVRKQIQKLKRIFDVNEQYEDKKSNYISKLNKTYLELQNNTITNFKDSESFPFNLGDNAKELTVGGFPGNNKNNYTYFNTGTTKDVYYNKNVNRDYIRFLNGNQFSFSKYQSNDTSYLGGINLLPGSSGSMVLDNNNKIVGIYWGALTNGLYGLFIPFDVKNDSLWNRLITFIKSSNEFQGSALRNILDLSN
ncbi:MAG: DUF31 family protein [Ureaplasma sp.]|nr:DUF31 family protein [Ureaplasma sp.]